MSLRREVYLLAVEAVTKAYNILAELPLADLQSESWKIEVNSISKALAKVHVVGSDGTVSSSTQFSSSFSRALLELTQKKLPLDQLKLRLNILANQINKSSEEKDRCIALMKEFNLKGSTDQHLWNTIQSNYDFENQQASQYMQEQQSILQQYNDLLIELTTNCYQKCIELGYLLVPTLCSIRDEMDMPIDIDRYRELIEHTRAEMETSFSAFIENIKVQSKTFLSAMSDGK